jgi:predicted aldo/keto reductase-like oxidoreductase
MDSSRRSFLRTATAAVASVGVKAATTAMPTRTLGKTGARVSILAFGGGSRFLMYDEEQALKAVAAALSSGITYFDTSDDYGDNHLSERRIGQVLKGHREGIFVATKLSNREPARSRAIVEESLRALQMDQVDLIHIHSLTDTADLTRIEAKGGVLDQLLKMKDEKLTRFIGITSHTDPAVLASALERHPFDCTQMALNGALTGMKAGEKGMVPNPGMTTSFQTVALPVARRKNLGILAMKVFAQDALLAHSNPKELLYYSLSLPVTAAVVGMPALGIIQQNAELARSFEPLPPERMKAISGSLSSATKAQLDLFFTDHKDS